MTGEQAKKLRAPFPAEQIGKLPKPTKKDNPKGRCDVCGGWHGLPAVHLDYVGHAAATDRLLQVDSEWTWEPMGVDELGRPAVVSGLGDASEPIGLWIKLTVAGVTRPGFGSGRNAKEAIGDAIRNAAMRFGVALDLWAKEDLSDGESPAQPPATAPADGPTAPSPNDVISDAQVKRLWTIFRQKEMPETVLRDLIQSVAGIESTKQIPKAKYDAVIDAIEELDKVPF